MLIILTTAQVLSETGDAYLVLNAMADSLFYFLPMLLAFTAAKKFGAKPVHRGGDRGRAPLPHGDGSVRGGE